MSRPVDLKALGFSVADDIWRAMVFRLLRAGLGDLPSGPVSDRMQDVLAALAKIEVVEAAKRHPTDAATGRQTGA